MSDSTKIKKTAKKESKTPQSMDELLSLSDFQLKTFKKGDFVKGTVVEIRPRAVFIDIGGKTEGMITGKELATVKDFVSNLRVGDQVTAQIRVQEDDRGYALLSLRATAMDYSWKFFEDAIKEEKVIEVLGKDVNHGGVVVVAPFDLFGFIPGSQISRRYDNNPSLLVGKKIKVKVLEVDKSKNRLVFSERLVSEPDIVEREQEAIRKMKVKLVWLGWSLLDFLLRSLTRKMFCSRA
jgi:ribosomal protein S1